MSFKKHISLLVLSTFTSPLFFNKAEARVIPLSDEVGSKSEDPYYFLAIPNKDATKTPDGTITNTYKAYRDDIVLKWRPYFAKDTKSQKEDFYKVSHLFKKARYVDGSMGSEEFIALLSYPSARAQILNAIEFAQKLLSVENNDLVTIQVSKTYKNNAVVDEKINLLTNKENKKHSFLKDTQDTNEFITESIKDKNGKILKVITYKNLPIELID